MSNQYKFLKVYSDIKNGKIDKEEMSDLYLFLKDRSEGTSVSHYFQKSAVTSTQVKQTLFEFAPELKNNTVLQQVFPGANTSTIGKELEMAEPEHQVLKYCSDGSCQYLSSNQSFGDITKSDESVLFLEKADVGKVSKEEVRPAIEEYKTLYKAGMASPAEILTLSRFYPKNETYKKAVHDSKAAKGDALVVGGPASVEMIDKQKHLITTEALSKAFDDYMINPRTRNIQIFHTNVQVGWPLPCYINAEGQIFKSGVDEKGLWVITELRDDITIAQRVSEEIEKGKIKSYSIAGSATQTRQIEKAYEQYMQVDELQLAEITLCEEGVNQGAHFDILKADLQETSVKEETLDTKTIMNSLRGSLEILESGVVLEKGETDKIVICAEKPNAITDALQLQIRKSISSSIPIEVRTEPFGEWIPLMKISGVPVEHERAEGTLEALEACNYRPAEIETIECHTCDYFADGGFCTLLNLPVDPEYVCDWFEAMPGAVQAERWAEASHQPYEEADNSSESPLEALVSYLNNN